MKTGRCDSGRITESGRAAFLVSLLSVFIFCNTSFSQPEPLPDLRYAIVIKQGTWNITRWKQVCDTLSSSYKGRLFTWVTSLSEVKDAVISYRPTHICFVCDMSTALPSFISGTLHPFTRSLDDDPYTDVIWSVLTGYPEDAYRIAADTVTHLTRTLLSGTVSSDLEYYTQGLSTHEATSGLFYVKHPDSILVRSYTSAPTDRTSWLVSMINSGIDSLDNAPVDIFITSGHGSYNLWQLHYPAKSPEGLFRSGSHVLTGASAAGTYHPISSANPKIYFGLGNCNIGQILNDGCMAPAWMNKGGAFAYTGYVIDETANSYQHGGTRAYYYRMSRENTWSESWFLSNIALQFDLLNNTPGVSPVDLNGSAFYGDPGKIFKMSHEGQYRQPLVTNELIITHGPLKDTVKYRVTMNDDGEPGTNGKWGNRHPAMILPFTATGIDILSTDAITAVVQENFVLLYIWYKGLDPLKKGDTREVVFTCNRLTTGTGKPVDGNEKTGIIDKIYPNPASSRITINYKITGNTNVIIRLFDYNGALIDRINYPSQPPGSYSEDFDVSGLADGVYHFLIETSESHESRKFVLAKN
ncbi:MAG: T9SS type A sorting domain-containing protein [Bacteroidales bacterium]|nr:T9SS type A sorting domain-containing protein [Bacteroidales bacterium]